MNISEKIQKKSTKNHQSKLTSSSTANNSIQKVAKGSIIVFIGTLISTILLLITRILFARFYESSEYGIFSLNVIILSIATIFGTMGLNEGISRQISFYLAKNQQKKVKKTIFCGLTYGGIFSVIISIITFLLSDHISQLIFHNIDYSYSIKIIAIAIPFYAGIILLNSIFRGYQRVRERVIFIDIISHLSFIILLISVIYLKLNFAWAMLSYTISYIITFALFNIYFFKKRSIIIINQIKGKFILESELLIFSIPIMLVSFLNQIITWTDTLMLGYFETTETVGLYNAALPIGRFISVALGALLFIYMPIVSELYSNKKNQEMKRTFLVLTKWLSSITFPIAMIFILFPNQVLYYSFGSEYGASALALQILTIGFFINNLMGPNGATLMAMGKTKFLMYATLSSAIINIILNYFLIPIFGIIGAALSSVIALIAINIIRSIQLYRISTITSFGKNILKPLISSSILFIFIFWIIQAFFILNLLTLFVSIILFTGIYISSLFLTKSIESEDIELLLKIESKTGLNLTKIKKLLLKFI